jgi:hypothetical protein
MYGLPAMPQFVMLTHASFSPAIQLVVNVPTHLLPLPAPLLHLAPEGPVPLNVKWTLRKAMAALAGLMVLYTVFSYRNYERDSFK